MVRLGLQEVSVAEGHSGVQAGWLPVALPPVAIVQPCAPGAPAAGFRAGGLLSRSCVPALLAFLVRCSPFAPPLLLLWLPSPDFP
jgi:hypothetical protein